jgi:hypothetical protein
LHVLDDINDHGDRGLIGIAIDPDFHRNGYLYLAYTYENNKTYPEGPKTARVVRVTVSADAVVPSSSESGSPPSFAGEAIQV